MYANKKNNFSKVVVLMLCLSLLVGGVIGGTIAYLMDTSEEVTNTFVAGEIGTLNLAETSENTFIVTPGVNITKDPTVSFNGNNVDAFVFVKVNQTGWDMSNDGMSYGCVKTAEGEYLVKWEIAEGWKHLSNGVYYREVVADETAELTDAEKYGVIKGNKITVDQSITKEHLDSFPDTSKLIFTAYAIQKANGTDADGNATSFGAAAAWDQVKYLQPKTP